MAVVIALVALPAVALVVALAARAERSLSGPQAERRG